jgi:ubiquinone biosynthesis accessory factor UbiJ
MPATAPWLASAEALFNRNIDASSQASLLAKRLNGTSLQLNVTGLTRLRAAVNFGRLALLAAPDSPADATIEGSPGALLTLLRNATPTAPAALNSPRSSVQISGNAEIANLYRQFFMLLRPDLEEELSRFVGDLPARQIARAARGIGVWAQRARRIAGENLAEYLQEESRDLVARTEIDEFLHGVDTLRESVDRLDARLKSLERRTQRSGT